MNTIALATTALAQSPSFWHAGNDLLRSKSLDRNSYDSGDWFNRIDWSGRESTFGSGLPPEPDNEAKWHVHAAAARRSGAEAGRRRHRGRRTRGPRSCCGSASPRRCSGSAARSWSRSGSASRAAGPEQTPGVIVMAIDDRRGRDIDRKLDGVVVVFNASPEATSRRSRRSPGRRYALHPVQASGRRPGREGVGATTPGPAPSRSRPGRWGCSSRSGSYRRREVRVAVAVRPWRSALIVTT